MNNGDGNLVRLRPTSQQEALFEFVQSADQLEGSLVQSFSFFLVRGDVSFADFNAVRDEFRPIAFNAVNALVDVVNAASPGVAPVTAPTLG